MPIPAIASSVEVGIVFTAAAWLALLVVVLHGRRVVSAIAAGTYDRGPYRDRPAADRETSPDQSDE